MSTAGLLEATARRVDLQLVDLAVAAMLAAATVLSDRSQPHPFVAVIAGLVVSATVAFRRRSPVVAVLVAGAGATVLAHTGDGSPAVLPLVMVLDYYMVGRSRSDARPAWVDVLLLGVPVVAVTADPNTSSPGNAMVLDVLSVWGFFFALPYVAGRVVLSRTNLTVALRMQTQRLEQQQQARAQRAVVEERARIARELHDVIAHSVSVMVIQAAAARAVAKRDPAAALDALRSVETCGRDALLDMRRMIGVLHRGDIELLGSASPGLAQLQTLADRARAAGLPVHVSIQGKPRALPPSLDLVSFRIVQEALTNAIKHAGPARASVLVTYDVDCLRLEVVDTGAGSGGNGTGPAVGHGLVGMRERLSLYGGELTTGDHPGGGFQVRAQIPLAGVAT